MGWRRGGEGDGRRSYSRLEVIHSHGLGWHLSPHPLAPLSAAWSWTGVAGGVNCPMDSSAALHQLRIWPMASANATHADAWSIHTHGEENTQAQRPAHCQALHNKCTDKPFSRAYTPLHTHTPENSSCLLIPVIHPEKPHTHVDRVQTKCVSLLSVHYTH